MGSQETFALALLCISILWCGEAGSRIQPSPFLGSYPCSDETALRLKAIQLQPPGALSIERAPDRGL